MDKGMKDWFDTWGTQLIIVILPPLCLAFIQMNNDAHRTGRKEAIIRDD